MKKLLLIIFSFIYLSAYSQVSITAVDVPLTENFNTLAITGTSSTVPSGWAFVETGSGLNSTYAAGTGSDNGGNTYSFGSASTTERAFGTLQSGSLISTIGVVYTNNTAVPITALNISYKGEQWRLGTLSRTDRLDFQVSTTATNIDAGTFIDVNNLDFTGPATTGSTGALDGNATGNFNNIIGSITGLNIAVGATFVIRWVDFNASGADDGLGIDDFSLTANPSVLPITLTSFTGKEANKSIVLNWVTSSEKNNKNFEILRSIDGKVFKSIGTVDGAGDSDTELKYSFVDANPFGGTNYYQLKQIDFDGKNSTSETIAVDSKIADTQITVYASNSRVNIGIASPNETPGKITLFDISGRKITEQNVSLNKGYNSLELNETLTPGVHFITLENEGKLYRQKFIK